MTKSRPLLGAVAVGLVVGLMPAAPAAADSIRADQWHLGYLKVAEANERARGVGVTVAVAGGGVDATHPDLAAMVLPPVAVDGETDTARFDPDGRGTALAGLIAGHGHGEDGRDGVLGLAPAAQVLPVVVRGGALADPGGRTIDADRLAAGIDLAVRNGAKIIVVGYTVAGSDRLQRAVAAAQDADAIVVAADGNRPGEEFAPYPAAYDGVLAAVPLSRDGTVLVASTSGRRLGFGVPGTRIMTTNTGGGYRVDEGTAAAGILAGAVALVRAAYPALKAEEIVHRLSSTAVDAGARGHDAEYGQGRLALVPALTRSVPLLRPPTPTVSPAPSARNSATAEAVPQRTPRGPLATWLLVLPLVLFVGWLVAVAVRAERRTPAVTRPEQDAAEPAEGQERTPPPVAVKVEERG